MDSSKLKFGLSEAVLSDLYNCFKRFDGIEQVLIFGSRARGNHQPGSDIDLAVVSSSMSSSEFSLLWGALDELPVLFKMDVLHFNDVSNLKLKENIVKYGQQLYP